MLMFVSVPMRTQYGLDTELTWSWCIHFIGEQLLKAHSTKNAYPTESEIQKPDWFLLQAGSLAKFIEGKDCGNGILIKLRDV